MTWPEIGFRLRWIASVIAIAMTIALGLTGLIVAISRWPWLFLVFLGIIILGFLWLMAGDMWKTKPNNPYRRKV